MNAIILLSKLVELNVAVTLAKLVGITSNYIAESALPDNWLGDLIVEGHRIVLAKTLALVRRQQRIQVCVVHLKLVVIQAFKMRLALVQKEVPFVIKRG